jgi:phospholipid/cholesterol/gamma-HCH transport system substrate-binding protein
MRNISTELKVGILILAGIAVIIYGSIVVTGWKPGQSDTYRVFVHMDTVAGLLVGSPVQTAGIKIGEVQTIELVEGRAQITLRVYKRYVLYEDARATMRSIGILGDKYIDINPGSPSAVRLKDGDTVRFVVAGSDLDSLVESAGDIMRDVRSVTASLRNVLGEAEGQQRMQKLLDELVGASENLNKFTVSLERVMRENEKSLGHTAQNLERFTAALDRITGGNEKALGSTFQNLDAVTAGLRRIVTDNETGLGSIVARLERFSGNIERITADNETGIKKTIDSLTGFAKELEGITVQNRRALDQVIADFARFSAALAEDGPHITGSLRGILEENRAELKSVVTSLDKSLDNLTYLSADLREFARDNRQGLTDIVGNLDGILAENRRLLHSSIANLDRSFEKLDSTMGNLNDVTGKLQRGEGTLGKLINDDTTIEELNSSLAGINKYLTEVNRLKLDIGGRTEYLTGQQEYKSYVSLKLQPHKDRFYVIELVDNPRGHITRRTIERTTNGKKETIDEVETADELQFTVLIAQRYFDTIVRGGLVESTFGLGTEQIFGLNDQFSIGLDVWDFSNDFGPHAKFSTIWRFYSNAFLVAGYDDFLSEHKEFRDAFFGIGVNFNEDALKPLFSSLPLSSVTGN